MVTGEFGENYLAVSSVCFLNEKFNLKVKVHEIASTFIVLQPTFYSVLNLVGYKQPEKRRNMCTFT